MVREIKFRAWYKKSKQMFPSVGFRDTDCGRLILPALGMVVGQSEEAQRYVYGYPSDEFILMQYIGLKDKDGKDIYEGDIVWHNYYDEHGVVCFNEDRLEFTLKLQRRGNVEMLPNIQEWHELIGNIYENPEP